MGLDRAVVNGLKALKNNWGKALLISALVAPKVQAAYNDLTQIPPSAIPHRYAICTDLTSGDKYVVLGRATTWHRESNAAGFESHGHDWWFTDPNQATHTCEFDGDITHYFLTEVDRWDA